MLFVVPFPAQRTHQATNSIVSTDASNIAAQYHPRTRTRATTPAIIPGSAGDRKPERNPVGSYRARIEHAGQIAGTAPPSITISSPVIDEKRSEASSNVNA